MTAPLPAGFHPQPLDRRTGAAAAQHTHRAMREEGAVSVQTDCWCMTCEAMILEARAMNGDQAAWHGRTFIVCPECGNKRCPRAAHHDRACTGSNEPGQPGSAYPAWRS